MSWLRDHFHHFVFPAFMAAEKRTDQIGEPFDVKASPHAPERLPTELKKLWTLCQEHEVKWTYDVREINYNSGSSKFRETARIHDRLLRDTLDSAMSALRHERCERLFFGGRDVWTFAVLCEKRHIPYMFTPELSRTVAGDPLVKPFLEQRGFTGRELHLDTGFAGSVPKCLARHFNKPFKFRLMSQSEQFDHQDAGLYDTDPKNGGPPRVMKKERWRRRPNQLFPNRKNARDEALETEYLAKYWRSGTVMNVTPAPERRGLIQFGPPPLGHAPSTKEKWQKHPNQEKIRRFTYQKKVFSADSHFGITDGESYEIVAATDIHLSPGFFEWWHAYPEIPMPTGPDEEPARAREMQIVQFFSNKATIQRAALLTSQLWRGIPYWKARLEPDKLVMNQISKYPNVFSSSTALATNSTVTYTTATNSVTANWLVTDDLNSNSTSINLTAPPTAHLIGQANALVNQPNTAELAHKIAVLQDAFEKQKFLQKLSQSHWPKDKDASDEVMGPDPYSPGVDT